MTRQTWQLIIGVGWCVSTLSACSWTSTATNSHCYPDAIRPPLVTPGDPTIHDSSHDSSTASEPKAVVATPTYAVIPPPPPLPRPPDLTKIPTPSVAVAAPPETLPPLEKESSPVSSLPATTPVSHEEMPQEIHGALLTALNYFTKERPDEAVRSLKGYSAPAQEYLMRLLPMLVKLETKGLEPLTPAEIGDLQKELESLMQSLRSRAELVIDKMCFCQRIRGFGNYDPLPKGCEFKPTQNKRPGDLVLIYLELRNFGSVFRNDRFVTCLDTTVELHQQIKGKNVTTWTKSFRDGQTPLYSLTPRNDCYNKYTFCVPEIPPGQYQLTLHIVDQTGQPFRRASKTIDFVVGKGQP